MLQDTKSKNEPAFIELMRSTQMQASNAMGGDVIRGLIECITNSDDSYEIMEEGGTKVTGVILIEVDRTKRTISVSDRAAGMDYQEVMSKLRERGTRSSGFEVGANVRGNRGTGAKDIVGLGSYEFETIKDGTYSCFAVNDDTTFNHELTGHRPSTSDDKKRLGIRTTGSRVTMHIKSGIAIPNRENMENRIRNHFELHFINQSPNRRLSLKDSPSSSAKKITHYPPKRKKVYGSLIEIPDYSSSSNSETRLTIFRNEERVQKSPRDAYRMSGILMHGQKAMYENTLFSHESNPTAHQFSGYLDCPIIDELMKAYDDRMESGAAHLPTNPMEILSVTRQGLQKLHPLYVALQNIVDPILEDLIKKEEASIDRTVEYSRSMRVGLSDVGRALARQIDLDLRENDQDVLEGSVTGKNTNELPDISVIPSHLIFYPDDKKKTLSVRIRNEFLNQDTKLQVAVDPIDSIEVSNTTKFKPHSNLEDFSIAQVRLKANEPLDYAHIEIRVGDLQETASAVIAEDNDDQPIPEEFSFEHPSIQIRLNRKKKLSLFIPVDIYDEHDAEPHVSVNNADVFSVNLNSETVFNEELASYEKIITITGRQIGATGVVTATLGNHRSDCRVKVGQTESQSNVNIEILNQSGGFNRALLDTRNGLSISIMGGHSIAKSYLGAGPKFPHQDTIQARILLSEITASAVAEYLLEHLNEQYEEMDAASYNSYHKEYIDKYLRITHGALVKTN